MGWVFCQNHHIPVLRTSTPWLRRAMWHMASRIGAFQGCMNRWEIGNLASFFFFLNFLYIYFFFLKQSLQSPDWSLGDALAVYPEH